MADAVQRPCSICMEPMAPSGAHRGSITCTHAFCGGVPDGPRPSEARVGPRRRRGVPRRGMRRHARPGALPRRAPGRRVRAVVRRAVRVHVRRRAADLLPIPGLLRDDGVRRRRRHRDAVRVPGVQAAVLRPVPRAVARRRRLRRLQAPGHGQGGRDAAGDGRGEEVEAVLKVPVLRGEDRRLLAHQMPVIFSLGNVSSGEILLRSVLLLHQKLTDVLA